MSSVTYQCNVCNKQFTTFCKLAKHKKTHKSLQFLCKLCDKIYTRKDHYQRHYRYKHAWNQLRIEDAFVKSDSTPPPEQVTTRRSQSNATDRKGSDERNEISEENVVELERKIGNCKQCQHESAFIKNENYSQKKHICVICKETFSTATSLDCHMKAHISKKSVSNGQVSLMLSPKLQEFTSTGEGNNYHQMSLFRKPFHFDWKSHNPILNVLQNEHLVSCKICKKSFSSESSLFTHMRMHAIYTYSCPLCERKFIEKDQLEVHMLRHEGKRLFSCSICNMSSIRKEEIQQHLACHASDNLNNI
ncbi:unnamed protein product [Clavelina lepadiformis]|uniref:C2H2-type domain-containing protein n=1 Tax=Clavelina lepadiformis TaxID=159417 RepID=A0ABP0GQ73_CLALP